MGSHISINEKNRVNTGLTNSLPLVPGFNPKTSGLVPPRRLRHWLTHLSLFDPDYEKHANHRTLLRYLHKEVTQPIKDADTDYVVTQAFTEYIRRLAPQEFDGISYRSVQHSGGVNFVLFDKSNAGYSLTRGTRPTFSLVMSGDSVTRRYIFQQPFHYPIVPTDTQSNVHQAKVMYEYTALEITGSKSAHPARPNDSLLIVSS